MTGGQDLFLPPFCVSVMGMLLGGMDGMDRMDGVDGVDSTFFTPRLFSLGPPTCHPEYKAYERPDTKPDHHKANNGLS